MSFYVFTVYLLISKLVQLLFISLFFPLNNLYASIANRRTIILYWFEKERAQI